MISSRSLTRSCPAVLVAVLTATVVVVSSGLLTGCGGGESPPTAGTDEHLEDDHGEGDHDEHAEGGEPGGDHETGVVHLSAEKLTSVELATTRAESRSLAPLLETTGEVGYEEDRIAHVAPRIPGRVQRVAVSLGDEVRRGQLLAVLDSVELGQAKAAYLQARTREELARRSFERERRLYADRITSEKEMLEAEADLQEAVSERQRALEALRLYGIPAGALEGLEPGDPGASLLPVHAPIAGRVVEKHATLGELASPGDSLFTVADLDHVWIWIDVFERDLARVHEDDEVEVEVESFPQRTFSGRVTYLSPAVEEESRTVRARIDVTNQDRLLRPGMFATVRVTDPHGAQATPSVVVPASAVVDRGGERLVFVPAGEPAGEGARFADRPVTVGRQEDGMAEILRGLDAGDEVVSEGAFFLESELAREELGGGHSH